METNGLTIYEYADKILFNYCRLKGYSQTNTYPVYRSNLKKTFAVCIIIICIFVASTNVASSATNIIQRTPQRTGATNSFGSDVGRTSVLAGAIYFNAMTYSEKLKDPRWQKLRLEILNRDEWTCQYCGAKDKTLHVHHYAYPKSGNPWDADGGDLNTLCEDCHENTHRKNLPISVEDIYGELVTWAHVGGEAKSVLQDINRIIRKNRNGA